MKSNSIYLIIIFTIVIFATGCSSSKKSSVITNNNAIKSHVIIKKKEPSIKINTENVKAKECIEFAETLIGVKYKYGSSVKENGFDCSGFVWYVFNHFNITVPRVSEEFTNAGKEVSISESKPGDIILFTGSDASSAIVGHMGLITENKNGEITFLHAASGGGKGVMKSKMSEYFITRFVKVNRVFLF